MWIGAGNHVRMHASVTAAAEKRLLVWMARRLPRAITSDQLSILGLAAMGAAAAAFAAQRYTPTAAPLVVIALALNWFGDSLDGTVARVRGEERPRFGYYVDHVIDLAGAAVLLAGIACSGLMNPALAASTLAAYLLVSAESYLATHASGVFRMSHFGFGPTELRILLAIGAIKTAHSPWIHLPGGALVRLFDIGGAATVAGLISAFAIAAVRNTRVLHREDRAPRAKIA